MSRATLFRTTLSCLFVATLFQLMSLSDSAAGKTEKKIGVFVSIIPQKFFVEQIGKEMVDVQVMVQPGASPHTYEPKPQQMAALSKTSIYFAIGLPFEEVWLTKIAAANRDMKIIHTDDGIEKLRMMEHLHHEDGEEPEAHEDMDNHEHGSSDPHIWLSPELVTIQAQHILKALKEADPHHAALYDTNCRVFISEIAKLDGELKAIFADKKGVQFMVFHPSWGYFARDYNLEQLPIEMEGKNPKPAQLQELISLAREKRISVIFAQPQFSLKSAQQVAKEINGEVLLADPLAYDWLDNLRNVAARFRSALK